MFADGTLERPTTDSRDLGGCRNYIHAACLSVAYSSKIVVKQGFASEFWQRVTSEALLVPFLVIQEGIVGDYPIVDQEFTALQPGITQKQIAVAGDERLGIE